MPDAQRVLGLSGLIQCLLQVSLRFDGNFDINLGEHVLQESPMSLYGPVLPVSFWTRGSTANG